MKPTQTPKNPCFSSGPCAKRPGWSLDALKDAALGRSHRAKIGKNKLADVIDRSKKVLGIPETYVLGIVPASDTGAVEMALWSMLGERGVDVLAWESFSSGWAADCKSQLQLKDLRVIKAGYGQLPDLKQADWARDVVFAWNGTTSGVRVPDGDWIAADRAGLSICDATSAVFAMEIPWEKLDVVTWSWQKVLGGEGAHGMIALSPRAVARLESFTPPRPLPKIFQMTKGGKLIAGIFQGETINTPSMLCVEDASGRLGMGGIHRRFARADRTIASESASDGSLGGAIVLGRVFGRRKVLPVQHFHLLQDQGPGLRRALRRRSKCAHQIHRVEPGEGARRVRHRRLSRCARGIARVGRRDG